MTRRRSGSPGQDSVAAMPLVWPENLGSRNGQPPRVYLDINHFIYLARADAGDPKVPDGYPELLTAVRRAIADKAATFPLSLVHYYEMVGITDPRQRGDVAAMMEELSDFEYLLGRPEVARQEIEASLDHLLHTRTTLTPTPIVGPGLLRAFGRTGTLMLKDEQGRDATAQLIAQMGEAAYRDILARANRQAEHELLAGPADEDVPALREAGYAPERSQDSSESRADYERVLGPRLDQETKWRTGRLRDVVRGRELVHEWSDAITAAMLTRDTTFGAAFNTRDAARHFAESMPSTRIAISIKTRYHRDGQHTWTVNDVHDIDALSVAVPYCDAVFTDKAARNALVSSPEVRALGTFVPRRPRELTQWLDALPRTRASG